MFVSEIIHRLLDRIGTSEEGATMVEYGLMVALIAVIALGAVTALGQGVSSNFQTIAGAL